MKIIIILLVMLFVSGTLIYARGRNERTPLPESSAPAAAVEPLSYEWLEEIIASEDPDTYLVDVRTEAEYKVGAIPSALNIPFDVIAENLPTEDRSDRIIVYCRSGNRSGVAAGTLESLGFTNVLDFGGVSRWRGELVVRK